MEGGVFVHREQKIALLDHLAIGEMHALQIAGRASMDFDHVNRDEAAGIFIPDRVKLSQFWLGDDDESAADRYRCPGVRFRRNP